LFEHLVAEVDTQHRAQFRSHYRAIRQLPASEISLQEFLDEYLRNLVHLYAATAGVVWFRSQNGPGLAGKSRIGWERLGLTGELTEAHQQLLQYGLTQTHSFLVRPYSAPARGAAVSNPTDSFLVLGPVTHRGEQIAVVELFLGPRPVRGRTSAERNRYVLWLDHLLAFFCRGIEARLLKKAAPLSPALEHLNVAERAAGEIQASMRGVLEQHLATFEGWNFGSLENNQAFTARLQELLDQFGLRVVCPHCGVPAILRCQKAGNSKSGAYLYDHVLPSGRTFHGGASAFPKLTLVPRPARRK
jgi:hypothetical protein